MTAADLSSLLPAMLPRLWAFALRIAGDRYDAEDLVQRACLHALERAHQLQPDTIPLSWMLSIVHSAWIGELRARRVRHRSSAEWDDDFRTTVDDPAARTPEGNLTNWQIVRAVQGLSEAQRVAMLLVAVEGLSYREAAETLGVPIGTVANRLSHARQAIGALFSERNERKMKVTEERQESQA
jgi:RNA polymerase sigma-70 factor (ECF subfamily)